MAEPNIRLASSLSPGPESRCGASGDRGADRGDREAVGRSTLERECRRLASKEPPNVPQGLDGVEVVRVLFVSARAKGAPSKCNGVLVVDASVVMR